MDKNTLNRNISCPGPLDISDEDVLKAMRDIQGYLDITPADAKELYRLAYRHAIERLTHLVRAGDVMMSSAFHLRIDRATHPPLFNQWASIPMNELAPSLSI